MRGLDALDLGHNLPFILEMVSGISVIFFSSLTMADRTSASSSSCCYSLIFREDISTSIWAGALTKTPIYFLELRLFVFLGLFVREEHLVISCLQGIFGLGKHEVDILQ